MEVRLPDLHFGSCSSKNARLPPPFGRRKPCKKKKKIFVARESALRFTRRSVGVGSLIPPGGASRESRDPISKLGGGVESTPPTFFFFFKKKPPATTCYTLYNHTNLPKPPLNNPHTTPKTHQNPSKAPQDTWTAPSHPKNPFKTTKT